MNLANVISSSRALLGKKQVLLACLPKSGSTYISSAIAHLADWKQTCLFTGLHRSEQDLEEACVSRRLMKYIGFSVLAQHHCRATERNIRLIQDYRFKTVVLVRNFMDCAVSLADHWDNESTLASMYWLDGQDLSAIDASRYLTRLQFIVRYAMPWYIQFYIGWQRSLQVLDGEILILRYEDFFKDVNAGFLNLFGSLCIDVKGAASLGSLELPAQDVRFNKGVSGRGKKAFANDPIAYDLLIDLLSMYPSVDFADVFSPL